MFGVVLVMMMGCQTSPVSMRAKAPDNLSSHKSHIDQSYALRIGDRIALDIFGEDGLSQTYMLDAQGNVSLQFIGTLNLQGLTLQQAERKITNSYENGYLRDVHLKVQIAAYAPIYVMGDVKSAGAVEYQPGMRILHALAAAGGPNYGANGKIGRISEKAHLSPETFSFKEAEIVSIDELTWPGDVIIVRDRLF